MYEDTHRSKQPDCLCDSELIFGHSVLFEELYTRTRTVTAEQTLKRDLFSYHEQHAAGQSIS